MADNKAAGNKGSDDGWLIAAIIVTAVTLVVAWHVFRKPIVYFKYGLDWIQIQAVALARMLVGGGLGPRGRELNDYLSGVFSGVWDANEVAFGDLVKLSNEVGFQTRLVILLAILGLAAYVARNMQGGGFVRIFSMVGVPVSKRPKARGLRLLLPGFLGGVKVPTSGPSFMAYQAQHWRVVTPSVDWDPDAPDAPPAARPPLEWMRHYGVPLREKDGFDEVTRAAAEKAFAMQCGDNWQGFAKAPLYAQAILAMCILQAGSSSNDRKVRALKEAVACAYTDDGFVDGEAVRKVMEPFIADPKMAAEVNKRSAKNAFVNTVLLANLDRARRKGGVFAPAEILWLRKVDRHAWYAVNSLGRKAHHTEASGSIAHWMAERACRAPIAEPYVAPAIDALEKYLTEHAITDLDKWYDDQNTDD
ncbi:hypothetical protein BHAOGJBA_1374 [Methylobacterium hispanicum]|uniref:DotM C-terminal cytoplasmic domain-containing protein n=1 Tax=Methylobacterium hispanicum TaxID=270350 RepID=A0AAV4ZI58_9HYPH|nr:hypothetical protein [Methylobacterium hispanicum]GJD87868.1 hypothetical protein BHAOGJBA_1374 [Methylobacterium hispanicum]